MPDLLDATRPDAFLPLTALTYEILLALAPAPSHGYGIIKAMTDRGGPTAAPETGTLYTAIRRMTGDGLIEPAPDAGSDEDRRRRYYKLTELGREVLAAESRRMVRLVAEARDLRIIGPGL